MLFLSVVLNLLAVVCADTKRTKLVPDITSKYMMITTIDIVRTLIRVVSWVSQKILSVREIMDLLQQQKPSVTLSFTVRSTAVR